MWMRKLWPMHCDFFATNIQGKKERFTIKVENLRQKGKNLEFS
jgi:hypothetical protein